MHIGLGQAAAQRFEDVSPSSPYYPYVQAMADQGITAGCSSSPPRFCPDDPLTRGQAAVLIMRAAGSVPASIQVIEPPMETVSSGFSLGSINPLYLGLGAFALLALVMRR